MNPLALRLRRLALLVVALGAITPVTASAQIYRWQDAEGVMHYSQGIESVPLRFRGNAVIVGQDRPAVPSDAPTASAPAGEITFTPGQPIMVAARINGGGSAQLMLDTGAERTVISPAALRTLGVSFVGSEHGTLKGVTGDAEVVAVRVESVEVSGVSYGPLMVVSHDTGFGARRGDGLLGRDFLDHFTVTIDNARGVVRLTPK